MTVTNIDKPSIRQGVKSALKSVGLHSVNVVDDFIQRHGARLTLDDENDVVMFDGVSLGAALASDPSLYRATNETTRRQHKLPAWNKPKGITL